MATAREVGRKTNKKLTNTRKLREFKQTLTLTNFQKKLLFGTMLGDGCLITSRSGKSARLQVRHNTKHREYVVWKYSFFKEWVLTQPRKDIHNNSYYFRTLSHPKLMEVKRLFYNQTTRSVPENITNILVSPLSLAIWAMDDGNGYKNSRKFRFNSYGFGLRGNLMLKHCLQHNFDLNTTIYNDSKGYVLYVPKKSAIRLYSLIRNYIVPCMRYKFTSLTP